MIEKLVELFEAFRPLVVRKFLRDFEFFLDLCKRLARANHVGDFVSHYDKITLLLFKVLDAASDMNRPVARNVRIDG